jgi:small subunit ribosomal protein S16
MLRIRLRRTGRSKAPYYRVVIADQRAPRDGDFVEIVGHYNPRSNPKELVLKEERVRHWLSQGAQPSETVHRLLHREGLIEEPPPQRLTKPSQAEREAAIAAAIAEKEDSPAVKDSIDNTDEAPAENDENETDKTTASSKDQ